METRELISGAIRPALRLLPDSMTSDRALVMLVAIGLQESRLQYRRQIGNGPARGLWQFEKGGGVKGVLKHDSTWTHALRLCAASGVRPASIPVWNALESDDILAAGFARLLLWSDPKPLPYDMDGGWNLYLRTWRPSKPHPETWPEYYRQATKAVMG